MVHEASLRVNISTSWLQVQNREPIMGNESSEGYKQGSIEKISSLPASAFQQIDGTCSWLGF